MTARLLALFVVAILLHGCRRAGADPGASTTDAELLHDAVEQLTDVIVYDIFNPPQAARAYTYASVAAYEVVRRSDSTYRTLAGQLNGLEPVPAPDSGAVYDWRLAGVHAFMTVGRALTFSRARMDSLRTAMDERIRATGVPREVAERSIAYGEQVAEHVLAWSRKDNFAQTRGYPKFTVTSEPGRWVPTPPAYMDAVEPNWGKLRPFTLDSASQFRPLPPHPYDTAKGSAFFEEVREVYETSKRLTDEQRALTAFWDNNPFVMNVQGHAMFATKKITPGGHWMGIAAIAARQAKAELPKVAATYSLLAMALADGFISSWDEKFRSNVVRPETVICATLDPAWQPLLQTPPFPEYTSGHSVISTAAAVVLTDLYGPAVAFTDSVEARFGVTPRSFTSFEQAAAEAAISRLYGGIHYRRAIEQGQVQGRRVGEQVVRRVRTHGPPAPPPT